MGALEEVRDAVWGVAEAAGPSVVGIGARWGQGTGVVLAEGRILTNAHNVRGEDVLVTFPDGRTAEATVAGVDPDGDLAVLAADTDGAPPVAWAESAPGIGSPVLALANPGGRGVRVTLGFVSGTERAFRGPRGRRIAGGIEHTAPLPRGSSGGPLVDTEGRLVGLNTSRAGDGFYVAIPADDGLRERVEALGRGDARQAPRLGIGIAPSFVARRLRRAVGLPERDGLLVRVVEDGFPAAAAGLARGDLIVGAGDGDVADADDLYAALDAAAEAGSLRLRLVRGTEEREVTVRLGPARPPRKPEPV
jgi:serine protease Do